jgi:hypothetical protein
MDSNSQYFEIMVGNLKELVDTIVEMNRTIVEMNRTIVNLEKRIKTLETKNNEKECSDFVEISDNNDFETFEKI